VIALALTDGDWFAFFSANPQRPPINFWTPTDWGVRSLRKGDYWYFVLKGQTPRGRSVAAGGSFDTRSCRPAGALAEFGKANGATSYEHD
jgi:hypothetical protein